MDPERKAKLAIGVVICVVLVFALGWGVVAVLPDTGDEIPPPAREEPREPIEVHKPATSQQTRSEPTERKPVNEEGPTRPGYTWVNGYYRKDGTYVRGHWRKK